MKIVESSRVSAFPPRRTSALTAVVVGPRGWVALAFAAVGGIGHAVLAIATSARLLPEPGSPSRA